ncbi:hypothetical protein V8E53_015130 [Lactarius tabidus]
MIRRYSLLPTSIQLHLPLPFPRHSKSTEASRPCRHLRSRAQSAQTPLVRLLKASAFPLPHQIKPPVMQRETPSPWVSRLPSPLRKLLHPLHHPSLPPYPLSFPLGTTQTPWRHPRYQTSISDFSTSASSNPALENIAATAVPSASPRLTSMTDRGATPEDDGSPTPDSRVVEDALHPPLVNRATQINTTTTLDPLSPSLPLVDESDRAMASRSPQEPIAGRTGRDQPPCASIYSCWDPRYYKTIQLRTLLGFYTDGVLTLY